MAEPTWIYNSPASGWKTLVNEHGEVMEESEMDAQDHDDALALMRLDEEGGISCR